MKNVKEIRKFSKFSGFGARMMMEDAIGVVIAPELMLLKLPMSHLYRHKKDYGFDPVCKVSKSEIRSIKS